MYEKVMDVVLKYLFYKLMILINEDILVFIVFYIVNGGFIKG